MGLILVSGGQYGSEGKGKVAAYMVKKNNAAAVVKIGGTNSGHTVIKNGKTIKLRMLPTAAVTDDECKIIFAAGSYLDGAILMEEMREHNVNANRIAVDGNAVVIESTDSVTELSFNMDTSIASTCSGTGMAVERRVMRNDCRLAKDHKRFQHLVTDTKRLLLDLLAKDVCVVVEGTQGYELSVLHTKYYPYCTSRDTSFEGMLSEVGVSFKKVDKTCMVFRSYPIRVGGNSGPLPHECSWQDVTKNSGAKQLITEYTTVSNRLRRVAVFDSERAAEVLQIENPDIIVMNHMDYIDYKQHGKKDLSDKQDKFLQMFQYMTGRDVNLIGNGPDNLFERS